MACMPVRAGQPFFCALLEGTIHPEVQGRKAIIVQQGNFIPIPAAHDVISSSRNSAGYRL